MQNEAVVKYKIASLAVSVFLLAGSVVPAAAEDDNKEGLVLGLFGGPAVPSENIANVYDILEDDLGDAYDYASGLGFTLGGKMRIGLSNSLSLSGGISFVQFPGQDLRLTDTATGFTYTLESTTNIIPVQAGLTWLPIRSVIIPYVGGHVMYTYRNTAVSNGSLLEDIFDPGQEIDPTVSSFGASLSAGMEINLGIRPFIDLTYMWSNLTGRAEGEDVKSFLTITIGLVL